MTVKVMPEQSPSIKCTVRRTIRGLGQAGMRIEAPAACGAPVCASSMVCVGGVCQLCAAARSRRLLIKQAVLPPNPDQTTRARCCRLVLGAYLANFSGFFFALFFFSRPLLLDTPKADKAMRLGVLESRYPFWEQHVVQATPPTTSE